MNLRCLLGHKWKRYAKELWVCERCEVVAEKTCVGWEMGIPFFEYRILRQNNE